jgi:serine/threonine protein kinase
MRRFETLPGGVAQAAYGPRPLCRRYTEAPVSERKSQAVHKDKTPQPFGPFVLERRIAIGGTAEVFYARPRSGMLPAPELVIKRPLSERNEEQFEALNREAELHRAVHHDNVVTVFGAGMVGKDPYLAMEYVDGVDLHRLMRLSASENRTLPPALGVYIAHQLALALHAVHSACDTEGVSLHITHGDVSPSNVYLSVKGDVKLGDFGVAHAMRGPSRDPTASVKGKFGYLAPEQLEGDPCDHRSDIFALGVVLGEMLIGGKIFPGQGQLAILLSIREGNIEPLRRAADQFPASLLEVCTKALARDPGDRYATAGALAEALLPLLSVAEKRDALAEWICWARDVNVFVRQFEHRLRTTSIVSVSPNVSARPVDREQVATSSIRRNNVLIHTELSFSSLLELAATGHLLLDDEVSVAGEPFRRVESIAELSRYLMPSTTTTTGQLFQPGVPDFTAELSEVPMLNVLARMRMRRESGALFVARTNRRGEPDRKDMHMSAGRLVHVASSDREELLGQYALRLKLIDQNQLDLALGNLRQYGGRLGEALIGLGLAEPTAVFRAIRSQGRDRVASLCAWREGRVHLYRGAEMGHVQFPLNLDLSVPMMAGAMLLSRQGEDPLRGLSRLHPGRRFNETSAAEEMADVPASLLGLAQIIRPGQTLSEALTQLTRSEPGERAIPEREARAAVTVALALEWVRAD